ncbi:hypothetical protein DV515_00016186 [Chloebia gouldiae]|uniref:Uncharacterized protein n=1 Tax=Chloebia gouldiae TaxID=44316 RepID=A0A3L8RT83_CHLGU|nr:hypothetical protein DV515_00016186 [Chloebia gouldiae]
MAAPRGLCHLHGVCATSTGSVPPPRGLCHLPGSVPPPRGLCHLLVTHGSSTGSVPPPGDPCQISAGAQLMQRQEQLFTFPAAGQPQHGGSISLPATDFPQRTRSISCLAKGGLVSLLSSCGPPGIISTSCADVPEARKRGKLLGCQRAARSGKNKKPTLNSKKGSWEPKPSSCELSLQLQSSLAQ